jgi:hypothetical protein
MNNTIRSVTGKFHTRINQRIRNLTDCRPSKKMRKNRGKEKRKSDNIEKGKSNLLTKT